MENHTANKPPQKAAASVNKGGLRGDYDWTTKTAVAKETASVIPFFLKTIIVVAVGAGLVYYIKGSWENRFRKKSEIPNHPANITNGEAETRANKIYRSVGILSGEFGEIVSALSHNPPLNHNAFIRIYNAFGKRESTYLQSDMNLTEWLSDQLDDDQLSQISTMSYGILV